MGIFRYLRGAGAYLASDTDVAGGKLEQPAKSGKPTASSRSWAASSSVTKPDKVPKFLKGYSFIACFTFLLGIHE